MIVALQLREGGLRWRLRAGIRGITLLQKTTGAKKIGNDSIQTPLQNTAAASTHQSSFKPNWTWRDEVDVEVMTPAVGEGRPVAAA